MRANSNGSCERAAAICAAWRQELGHDRHLERCSPNADSVYDLIDKSSIFCIKSSQLYISVAPVTISDNSIYLSHIMPTDVFWHFEPFHILISNLFVVKACLKIVPKRLFTSQAALFAIVAGRGGELNYCVFTIFVQVSWLLLCITDWLFFLPCIKWFWFMDILSQCLLQVPMQLMLMTQVFFTTILYDMN